MLGPKQRLLFPLKKSIVAIFCLYQGKPQVALNLLKRMSFNLRETNKKLTDAMRENEANRSVVEVADEGTRKRIRRTLRLFRWILMRYMKHQFLRRKYFLLFYCGNYLFALLFLF